MSLLARLVEPGLRRSERALGASLDYLRYLARKDGVAPDLIRAAVRSDLDALPEELETVARFAEAGAPASGEEERYGEAGLAEPALGIASCRVFPATKRALGYATSCALVQVDV